MKYVTVIMMSEFLINRSNNTNLRSKTLKEYEKTEIIERKRNLLYLIAGYLRDRNLLDSYQALVTEAQLTSQYEVCDNIDLDIILQDYQSYYITKFNKTPKIVKKLDISTKLEEQSKKKARTALTSSTSSNRALTSEASRQENNQNDVKNFEIAVKQLGHKYGDGNDGSTLSLVNADQQASVKALCDFNGYSQEWREMADLIVKEIVPKNLGVSWKDCVGVDEGVELLKETVIYPMKHPELFTGLVSPWRGVLLFGPPGTGKTHLAKAVACESSSTFINVRSSSFISKWRGESERMLKVLFDVAKYYAPTTIFIDEIDAIASKHEDSHHDASRRLKSELLIQMDGILNGDEQVFVLATTNAPWNLDPAILRRFEKRVLLNAPTRDGRINLFKYFFNRHLNNFHSSDFFKMAEMTNNYSGSDIKCICKEAIMGTVREVINSMDITKGQTRTADLRKPVMDDVTTAIQKVTPTANIVAIEKYTNWYKSYGNS